MNNKTIHIAFGLYDKNGNYSMHTATTMVSVFSNTKSSVVVHILHDDTLLESNKSMLLLLGESFNQKIQFHEVEMPASINDYEHTKNLSPGSLFRISLCNLLHDLNKIIYLDSDIVVCIDILELWNINIDEFAIAAVLEYDCSGQRVCQIDKKNKKLPLDFEHYFNAGVIVFNLKKIRMCYNMWDECFAFLNRYPEAPALDQPALNYVFQKDCKFLSNKFNYWPGKKEPIGKCVYHFLTGIKPYMSKIYEEDIFYWKYFKMTPWGNDYEKFLSYYGTIYPLLEEGMMVQKIRSRKIFFRNFIIRFFREIKLKLQKK